MPVRENVIQRYKASLSGLAQVLAYRLATRAELSPPSPQATCASGYGAPENRVAARREKECSAWLVQRHSLRSADPSRRNERQEPLCGSVEGKIFILRILALRAHVFKSRCSCSPCCWWYLLVLVRFLSSCSEQLAGTLFRTKRYHQQPTQPRLVYSALGGRKCGRIPRTQPPDTGGTAAHT